MSKSPEQYFAEQDFSLNTPNVAPNSQFSAAEKVFLDKYFGEQQDTLLQSIGLDQNTAATVAPVPDQHPEMAEEENLIAMLRSTAEIQMVGFFLSNQEFTIPTVAVQEVIRAMPVARLPAAPEFVAGVVNLRGKVTPLIRLRDVLEVSTPRLDDDKFIIVCRRQGLQVGMLVERIHTMYRVPQADIDWNIEAHLGINVDFVAGLLKLRELLVGIISVDRVIASVLK